MLNCKSQALLTNEDFEIRLSRPDSVLDESFIIIVKEYATLKCEVCCIITRGVVLFFSTNPKEFLLRKQGRIYKLVKEGVLLAASNYKGYTKMCNLLVDWMKEFHHPKTVHVLSCLLLLLDSIFMEEVKKALIQLKPHEDPTIVDNAIREVMSSCGDLPMTASSQKLLNVSKFDSYVRRRRDIQVLCSLFQDITCHHTYVYYIHHTKERLQKHVSDNEKDYRDHVNRFCEFCCKNELHYLRTRNQIQSAFGFALSQLEFQLDNHVKHNSTRIPDLSTWAVGISLSSLIRAASIQLHRNCSITVADLSKIYDLCQESEMRENGEDKHGNGDKDKYREEEEEKPADVEQTQINIDFLQQSLMIETLSKQILHKYIYLLDYALCQSKINVNNGHDNVIIKEQRNELINDLTNISTQICHDKNYDISFFNTFKFCVFKLKQNQSIAYYHLQLIPIISLFKDTKIFYNEYNLIKISCELGERTLKLSLKKLKETTIYTKDKFLTQKFEARLNTCN
ncbi:hypothetical protein RFI_32313 [Reticulomyxa filosa]|uniref:Uncharacterized protein n=1 Tax=Reticulomyxa filosa TaxID=46433 RepID=X6LT28_RETFI|nr:hypothetical protein RFI_32313 [Reticulomyxa filosa]|eukprot:ETO05083.1 hypothetical protein RFI_32313 [Reticulomyxa filosa]